MRHRFPRASLAPDGFAVNGLDFKAMSSTSDYGLEHCSQYALVAAERADESTADIYGIRWTCRWEVVAHGWSFLHVASGATPSYADAASSASSSMTACGLDTVGARSAWRQIVHHLGIALGGRPAAAFATRLMVPVSNDTLLRVVRRHITEPTGELSVIGIEAAATLLRDMGCEEGQGFFFSRPLELPAFVDWMAANK